MSTKQTKRKGVLLIFQTWNSRYSSPSDRIIVYGFVLLNAAHHSGRSSLLPPPTVQSGFRVCTLWDVRPHCFRIGSRHRRHSGAITGRHIYPVVHQLLAFLILLYDRAFLLRAANMSGVFLFLFRRPATLYVIQWGLKLARVFGFTSMSVTNKANVFHLYAQSSSKLSGTTWHSIPFSPVWTGRFSEVRERERLCDTRVSLTMRKPT